MVLVYNRLGHDVLCVLRHPTCNIAHHLHPDTIHGSTIQVAAHVPLVSLWTSRVKARARAILCRDHGLATAGKKRINQRKLSILRGVVLILLSWWLL